MGGKKINVKLFSPIFPVCSGSSLDSSGAQGSANLTEEELRKNFEERQKKERRKMLEENHRIRKRFNQKKPEDNAKMMEQRQSLPAWKERSKILDILKNNQVLIIIGIIAAISS